MGSRNLLWTAGIFVEKQQDVSTGKELMKVLMQIFREADIPRDKSPEAYYNMGR